MSENTESVFQIEVAGSDLRFDCLESEFVLAAMVKNRRGPIRFGCFGGGCGICKMKIVSGDFQVEKKMSRAHISAEEEQDGIVLLCCVKPLSDLVLERIK
jgi:ferredoxin